MKKLSILSIVLMLLINLTSCKKELPTLSINYSLSKSEFKEDYTVEEANTIIVTYTLSEESEDPVTFNVGITAGTASSNDFELNKNSITIKAGEKTAKVSIEINGDTEYEDSETFTFITSNLEGAELADNQKDELTITIIDPSPEKYFKAKISDENPFIIGAGTGDISKSSSGSTLKVFSIDHTWKQNNIAASISIITANDNGPVTEERIIDNLQAKKLKIGNSSTPISGVEIFYLDSNGELWGTIYGTPSDDDYFEIISSNVDSSLGFDVYTIRVQFKCTLYNENGNKSIELTEGNANYSLSIE